MDKLGLLRSGCVVFLCIGAAVASPAQITVLYNFFTDGVDPQAELVQATDGYFYGTASNTVFKINSVGPAWFVYQFCLNPNCPDGGGPQGLVLASDGNLYGTTGGGGSSGCNGFGCGTVFRLALDGTLTTLHTFQGVDGASPYAGLV